MNSAFTPISNGHYKFPRLDVFALPDIKTMPPDSRRMTIHKRGTLNNKHRVSLIIVSGLIMQATLLSLVPFLSYQLPALPMRTSSLSGSEYIQEVLRMKLEVFQFLCAELKCKGGLAPS